MKKLPALALLALVLTTTIVVTQVAAQEADAPTLTLADNAEWGQYLTDSEGMSLYLYTLDEDGTSACVDACVNNWPPVLVPEGAEVTVTEGLDAELIGTIERADGTMQLTYGGAPLYSFRRDTEPGHTRGQGLGGQFYLVSTTGTAVTEAIAEDATVIDDDLMAALMSEGRLTFSSHCAVCHGAAGAGAIGPGFVGNSILGDKFFVINRVLDGFIDHGMPPFGGVLSDRQVSAVTTYIRNSWGNEFGPILEEEVAAER
ncbi:MAG TPA: c-type cytochrome [Trueperaceae bacterium]|nr:c-type cytochrome [Trueperaceae bacterium]